MVNYFIYAKDNSASTCFQRIFYENALKTLELFKSDVKLNASEDDKIVYLHWGRECEEVNEEKIINDHMKRMANGKDTQPDRIIQWIKSNVNRGDKIKLLYIITDGIIHRAYSSKCLQLNEDMNYEKVYYHAMNDIVNQIDLSAAATFFKNHCIIYRNNEKVGETDISQGFDYTTITIDNFATEKESMKCYIKLKYLNSSSQNNAVALNEIEKLTQLRDRLLNSLSSLSEYNDLETTDKKKCLQAFKQTNSYEHLNNPSYDLKQYIDKSITILINYITCDRLWFPLEFDSKLYANVSEEDTIDVMFREVIEFPDIVVDDETPVILYTKLSMLDRIETSESDFSEFTSTMECPLFLLNNDYFGFYSVGWIYHVDSYKQLLQSEKANSKTTRTRRPIKGGIVLVNTDDFDAYNDYIISAIFFNFIKMKYNIGLLYFVLWKICKKNFRRNFSPLTPLYFNVLEQYKKYMLRRVVMSVCNIGLSSLPLDPQVNRSLNSVLWHCVGLPSDIFKSDPVHFLHERLRNCYGITPHMIEILKNLHYDLDLEYIRKRRDSVTKHVMELKKLPTRRDKVFYLVGKIFKNVNGFLVSEIENQGNVKKLNYLKLRDREILTDDEFESSSSTAEGIDINDYVFVLHRINDSGVQICEKTLRPYFMIDEYKSFYSKLYETGVHTVVDKVDGIVVLRQKRMDSFEFSKILSYHNLFVQCVKGLKKFPTLEEYSNYILKKRKFKGDLVTIFPVDVNESIERAFLAYQNVIKDKSVSEFVSQCNKYASRSERIKTENIKTFEDDKEILEFIAKEEIKVKLKNAENKSASVKDAIPAEKTDWVE